MAKDFAEEMKKLESSFQPLSEGDIVEGTVLSIREDEVIVDISYKSEGIIPFSELTFRSEFEPQKIVKVGDKVRAKVIKLEDEEGRIILSKKKADFERSWGELGKAFKEGRPVEGEVVEVIKGGLVVDLGLRAFLPASQVDVKKVKDISEFVGKRFKFKVIKMEEGRNNVVVSRRLFLQEETERKRREILEKVKVGDVLKGEVSNIVDFGVFVDVGGISGLVHFSELSWRKISDPHEVVELGEEVKVKVLGVDREKGRLSLSLRRTQPNPWEEAAKKYEPGDKVKAKISKFVSFGAFLILLPDELEGLLHYSEMENPLEKFKARHRIGEEIEVRILSIDPEKCRISFTEREPEEEPLVQEVDTRTFTKVELDKSLAEKLVSSKEVKTETKEKESPELTLEEILEDMKKTRGKQSG
jgi:small subunit ribosomal protein S1